MKKIIENTIVILLATLFTYSAISKLLEYDKSKMQMGQSPFISDFAGILVWAVPVFEIVITALLLVRVTRIVGLYLSLFIMSMFSAYIYAMLHYSYYVPCSCGGVLSSMSWQQHLWFNLSFVSLSVIGIYLHIRQDIPETEITKNVSAAYHAA